MENNINETNQRHKNFENVRDQLLPEHHHTIDPARHKKILEVRKRLLPVSFTKIEKEGYCNFHSHRHCLYSGIYYFDNNYSEKSAKICFRSSLNQFSDYWIKSKNDDIISASKWCITPETKKLILFPSYLEHAILKHNEDTTRYSLAFNLFPIGEYGDGDSSYNTDWLQK